MTPAARIQTAIEILDAIALAAREGGAPADAIFAEAMRARRYAGSKDRRGKCIRNEASIIPHVVRPARRVRKRDLVQVQQLLCSRDKLGRRHRFSLFRSDDEELR